MSVTAKKDDVRRMIVVLTGLAVLSICGSVWRGDSFRATVGYALVGLACGGFVFACYLWAKRKS
jgi:hypothetical protein